MAQSERERVVVVGVDPPPLENPVTLPELVQRARSSSGHESVWLAGLVNERLDALGPGAGAEVGPLLLEWLEEHAFDSLVATDGWPCRAAAVQAVMELGYPHALSLDPEDLEFLRVQLETVPRRKARPNLAAWAGLVSSGLLAVFTGWVLASASFKLDPALVLLALGPPLLGGASMLGTLVTRPRGVLRSLSVLGGALAAVTYGNLALIFGGVTGRGVFEGPVEAAILATGLSLSVVHLGAAVQAFLEFFRRGQSRRSQRTS